MPNCITQGSWRGAADAVPVNTLTVTPLRLQLLHTSISLPRRAEASQKAAGGGQLMLRRLKRITEEISTMSTSLPASWDSCIFVAVDDERMDVLRWGGAAVAILPGEIEWLLLLTPPITLCMSLESFLLPAPRLSGRLQFLPPESSYHPIATLPLSQSLAAFLLLLPGRTLQLPALGTLYALLRPCYDLSPLPPRRALILPAPDTPYANGAFVFYIYLPADYPNVPPKVRLVRPVKVWLSVSPPPRSPYNGL